MKKNPNPNAILAHLTYAAQALQAAYELAREAGDEPLARAIRDAAMPTASAISRSIGPHEHRSEVLS